jgi:hypothetical protein
MDLDIYNIFTSLPKWPIQPTLGYLGYLKAYLASGS